MAAVEKGMSGLGKYLSSKEKGRFSTSRSGGAIQANFEIRGSQRSQPVEYISGILRNMLKNIENNFKKSMKAQFDQKLLSSFYLWFDDRVVRYGEAVESGINQKFYYSDNSVDLPSNQIAYYSPDRQFVSNMVDVSSGVYIKQDAESPYVFVEQQPNTSTGLIIDNDQGRVILNSSMGSNLEISGDFSRKTLNTYITNESEEELLLNTRFSTCWSR